MDWGLVIAAVVAAALAYGYWNHTKQSRHLAGLLKVLAAKYRGQVKPATFLTLPQLRFVRDGRRILVTALDSGGADVPDRGPFTLIDLQLDVDSGQTLRIERAKGDLQVLLGAVAPARHPLSGHAAFDQAFRITGGDPAFVSHLLGPELRQNLLESHLPGLGLRVNARKVSVHMDGVAPTVAALEEMIALAQRLAEKCAADPSAS